MRPAIVFILFTVLLSCDEDEQTSVSDSVRLAAIRCNKVPSQMVWLDELIQRSKDDPTLMGSIYAGTYDGSVVFIHQPMILSCLACVVYDCAGNRLDTAAMDHQKLHLIMDDLHLIYSPY